MAIPMAIGMAVQVLYNLIDICFVAQLGEAAIAGVSAGANMMFLVMALTQVLNAILAPILIVGWGTGVPLGVAGAGLACTLSVFAAVLMLSWYFAKHSHYVKYRRELLVFNYQQVKKIIAIGLPVGGEFFLMFIYMLVVYWVIKDFGNAAQAGFGLGMRMMQAFFLPVMAVSFAIPAIVGQNLGAGFPARVRETFFKVVIMECLLMALVTLLCKWHPNVLIGIFSKDPDVVLFGAGFLSIIFWNFIAWA